MPKAREGSGHAFDVQMAIRAGLLLLLLVEAVDAAARVARRVSRATSDRLTAVEHHDEQRARWNWIAELARRSGSR
jgi:hypothetical protein